MVKLTLIPNSELSNRQLEEIIKIKSIAWNYNFDQQLAWIRQNLKESDLHVLLSTEDKNLAYLNLIEIEVKIDGFLKKGYGIGNVCSCEKNRGWGKEIMARTNSYLAKDNRIGLLFCKKTLVNFYYLNSWKIVDKEKLSVGFNNDFIETMYFNCNINFDQLEYYGIPF